MEVPEDGKSRFIGKIGSYIQEHMLTNLGHQSQKLRGSENLKSYTVPLLI
jgi:hypothetical protein